MKLTEAGIRKSARGCSTTNLVTVQRQRNGHQACVAVDVEQLAAVARPSRKDPSADRDLGLGASPGERLDIDLRPSGLARKIRDPLAIGENLPSISSKRVRKIGKGFLSPVSGRAHSRIPSPSSGLHRLWCGRRETSPRGSCSRPTRTEESLRRCHRRGARRSGTRHLFRPRHRSRDCRRARGARCRRLRDRPSAGAARLALYQPARHQGCRPPASRSRRCCHLSTTR